MLLLAGIGVAIFYPGGYTLERQSNWLGQEKPVVDVKATDSGISGQINLPKVIRPANQAAATRGVATSNSYRYSNTNASLSGGMPAKAGFSPRRLNFPRGATSTTVSGAMGEDAVADFVLGARAGQTLTLTSTGNVSLEVVQASTGEIVHLSRGAITSGNGMFWEGVLWQSGD